MKPGLVSVIIPNYNYAKYLREAIDSVLAQTYAKVEVVVVDDGSTDGSQDVIAKYGDRITAILQQNQGVSAARNNGVAATHCEFVAFLDADDAWLPTKIEKQIAMFRQDPKLGLVHVGVEEVDADGHTIGRRLDGMSGDVSHELLLFERPVVLGGGSGLMVPRSVFEQVGGFDTRLSTSADWDLFYRIGRKHKVGFVPECLLRYRYHGSNMHGKIHVMEHDMLLGYEKAFTDGTSADRDRAYGNLYKTLAGSFFVAGRYRDFARNTLLSLWSRPSNIGYFLTFPIRRIRR
jgi:glycosyltransferase involved in cell wall biosynthesis